MKTEANIWRLWLANIYNAVIASDKLVSKRRAGPRRKYLVRSWLRDKRILILILVFLAFASWLIYDYMRPISDKVSWIDNYEKALEVSKLNDKPLMIYFHTEWCSWCRKLERDTFGNDEVASLLNEKFICLRINVEDHPSFMTQYEIPGFPTILFFSSEGKEIGRILGYKSPDTFMIMANPYISRN